MLPLIHIVLGVVLAVFLKIFSQLTSIQILIILLASVLMDVDHWLIFVVKKKSFSINKSYQWFLAIKKQKDKPVFLCIFHTIEFFILILILSLNSLFFKLALAGMLYHMALDIIDSIIEKEYKKEISLIYAAIKWYKSKN